MNMTFSPIDEEFINNFILEEKMSYFSCTIFDWQANETFSQCNNMDWLRYYYTSYRPTPPVKKYIIQNRKGIIWWDKDLYDPETSQYIDIRNEICNTSMICTFVPEGPAGVGAISFGSIYGQESLINTITKRSKELTRLFENILSLKPNYAI